MTPERWRCFVAVPIPELLRAELGTAVDGWRQRPDLADLRWSDPAGWHVTLAFLGSIDPGAIPSISHATREVATRHSAMRLRTGGLGGFRSAARARVAWYGIDDGDNRLVALADDVRRTLRVAGGTPFRAHLTLGRAKHDVVDLRGLIAEAVPPSCELVVDRVDLMRSRLGEGPARYERLASVPVGEPAHV